MSKYNIVTMARNGPVSEQTETLEADRVVVDTNGVLKFYNVNPVNNFEDFLVAGYTYWISFREIKEKESRQL